jgi:uncharacterized membrane protein YdbT with pleckstrin-like domain
MITNEDIIWTERAGMKDFYVNPLLWIKTILTLGIYVLYTYFVRIYDRYTLTNERLIKESGLFSKERDEIELFRVKDTNVKSSFFQRLVGYGTVVVKGTDGSGDFYLENLPDAMTKREQIRSLSNQIRESKGIRTIINE